MAARRLTGSKPVRRRPRKVRFRSRRGVKRSSTFRAHKGGYPRQRAFSAHAARAIRGPKIAAVKALKTARLAAYKGTGTRNPYPVRPKAQAYKAAGHHAPAGWTAKRKKLAKYRAVKAKRV